MNAPVKYVAKLDGVRETSLVGSADLAFWRQRLRTEGLVPYSAGGAARILVSATDARFKGVRFREFIVSVFVAAKEEDDQSAGCWLAQAFNSNRFFAFVERNVFSTPYDHALVDSDPRPPARLEVTRGPHVLVRAAMGSLGSAARRPVRRGEDGWSGPVYLPNRRQAGVPGDRVFVASIAGETEAFPFLAGVDQLAISPSPAYPALDWLVESGFAGMEWQLRPAARHAKSKTYRRSQAPLS